MIPKAPVHKALKRVGLSRRHIPKDMAYRIMQILVMLAVLIVMFFFAQTLPVIKAPGTFVGASVVYLDQASHEAFAVKALDMGLDFMVINGTDPDVRSFCIQDEKKFKFKCYFTDGISIDGKPLKLCDSPAPGCDSISIHQPWEMERAAMTCTQLPPRDCVLRPMPMWPRVLLKVIITIYLCLSAIWILMGHKSLHEKVIETGRDILK